MAVTRTRRGSEPASLPSLIRSSREREGASLEAFAQRLGISRANLCDIEQGRKRVSAERASRWARVLGHSEALCVQLAIQAELDAAGLRFRVEVQAA